MKKLTEKPSWIKLNNHYSVMSKSSMNLMFDEDADRFDKFSIKFNDILLDYSKNIINEQTLEYLTELSDECQLKNWIESMFTGDSINFTEGRAVLHTALRNRSNKPVYLNGKNVMDDIHRVLEQMNRFCAKVHGGEWLGFNGDRITDIVNIGIGGSDLGPAMVCNALKSYAVKGMSAHFVSNVDATHLEETLKKLNPATTLFLIASKTFTTQETITNANSAKDWFLAKSNGNHSDIAKHFVALSTNEKDVTAFGIDKNNMFEFWDWVGGRYSLWSAIGLPIALYIGFDKFEQLLQGAFEIDEHFRTAPLKKNIPVILALLGVWYTNFFNCKSHAVIPYDQYLEFLPDFLQQLDMESNGKFVTRSGEMVDYPTGPIIWGKPGTNAQHSFFQLIHQATQIIPADFIAPIKSLNPIGNHHDILISNFLAQTEALMKGKSEEVVLKELQSQNLTESEIKSILPHKVFMGNRPTNTILIDKLTPKNLGSIIAIYEHKVFVQGVIWNINSFDQWGVELGKQLAKAILPQLKAENDVDNHDSSTNSLINYFRKNR
jgi:glucose-6-phosphate isomerase